VLDRLLIYERRIENSMFRIMAELQRLRLMREMEQAKAVEEESPPEPSLPSDKEVDLKKQSQFAPAQIGANSFTGEDYENKPSPGLRENKPKQSQFHAPVLLRNPE